MECTIHGCKNGGDCSEIAGPGFSCACGTGGWGGAKCDVDVSECLDLRLCFGKSKCQESSSNASIAKGDYVCSECDAGYGGKNCSTDENECAGNVCKNGAACTSSDLTKGNKSMPIGAVS